MVERSTSYQIYDRFRILLHNFLTKDNFNKRAPDEMLGGTSQPPDHFLPGHSFAVE